MNIHNPYQWIAAMATLDKWHLTGKLSNNRSYQLKSKVFGVVWHDRYLCGDVREPK